jgi:hypothetical protein
MQRQEKSGIFYPTVVSNIFLEQRSWIVYLRGWSDKLICVLDLARAGVALVYQIEQLPNPAHDFIVVQILRPHPCLVG